MLHLRWDKTVILQVLLYSVVAGLVTLGLILLMAVVNRTYFNDPPLTIASIEPYNLGALCPGQETTISLQVTVNRPIIMHYYISVMDAKGTQNIIGSPRVFTDMLHPHPAIFIAALPWTVPIDLPAGQYRRVVAARNAAGNQNTVFVERFFKVDGNGCPSLPIPH